MFYTIIKNFFLKKIVTKKLLKENSFSSNEKINTIGLLVDETYFGEKEALIAAIEAKGFKKEAISVLIYKDKIKKKEAFDYPSVSLKNISISGEILTKSTTGLYGIGEEYKLPLSLDCFNLALILDITSSLSFL